MSEDGKISEITIRPARDSDAEGLVAMIESCFDEYPGCVMDIDGIDKELLTIGTYTATVGGKYWVAERGDGLIVGSCGYGLHANDSGDNLIEVKRLYVANAGRRQGLATRLFALVEEAAEALSVRAIDLWSDTRFVEGHAFYVAQGFRQTGVTRDLHDLSNSTEYHFIRAQR